MDKKRGLQVVPASPVLPENLIAREDAALWLHACIRQEQQAEECLLKGIAAESESFYRGSPKSVEISGCSFHDCDFEKASFVDVLFRNCDFSGSRLTDCYFHRCAFLSVKGVGADFHESLFKEVRMEDSVFSYANFSGTSWESTVLNGCDLQESYLEECRLKKTELNRVKLNRANLFGTALRGLDLRSCEIEGILISDEKKELAGAVVDLYQAAELARLMGLVIR